MVKGLVCVICCDGRDVLHVVLRGGCVWMVDIVVKPMM